MKKSIVMNSARISILFLLVLFSGKLYSQSNGITGELSSNSVGLQGNQKTTLLKALNDIKTHYKVSFLYQKKNISGKTIEGDLRLDLPLSDLLSAILSPNKLQFEKTRENTYVIFPSPSINESRRSSEKNDDSSGTNETAKNVGLSDQTLLFLVITGKVVDEKGNGLSGVSVTEKGTRNGTTTNARGEFTINVKDEASILEFSYVGYSIREVTVGSNNALDVKLQLDVKQADEVIVVAYGSKTKKDLTGSVSSIKADDIIKSPSLSPQQAMQGRMPGVFVSTPGGDPNSAPTIRIRGVTTFSGRNSDPLYVIDGVVSDEYGSRSTFTISSQKADDIKGSQNIFNLINPADIESISVLKDASSAAAYGARAANGVILITTKKGKEGRARVNFTAQKGISNLIKKLDVLNVKQYTEIVNEAQAGNPDFIANAQNDVFRSNSPAYLGNSQTYDWQTAVTNKNATIEDYNLSISGGSQNATYYVGGGFAHQESDLKFNNQRRYTLSTRSEFKVNKYFELGETVRLAYTNMYDGRDNTGVPIHLLNVFQTAPWQPIYGEGPGGFATVETAGKYGQGQKQNWLAVPTVTHKELGTAKVLGNVYATLLPFKGLKITGSVGADYFTGRRTAWSLRKFQLFYGDGATRTNSVGEVRNTNFTLIKRLSANYTFNIGNHFIDLYSHAEDQSSRFNSFDGGRSPITDTDDPDLFTISGKDANATTYKDRNGFINYLGRVGYKYLDKYYLDVTVLRQGTSVFNPDGYQWGTFPSAAAAWRISRERFFTGLPFNDLKLKFGIGELGNSDTKGWQYLSLVNNVYASYTFNGVPIVGAFLTNYPNATLTWERLTTYNGGVEGTILNNKLNFSLEYYKRITSKILQPYKLPATAGIVESPYKNIGSAENSGIEVALNYQDNIDKVNYSVGFNFTTTKNKVTKLNENTPVGTPSGFVVLGDPINSIYGYQTAGVIKTQKQLDEYKTKYATSPFVSQLQLGDLMFSDIGGMPTPEDVKAGRLFNNKPDGKIDDYDAQSRIGKRIPGFFYGINLAAEYNGLDISVLFSGVGNVQRVNPVLLSGLDYGFSNKLTTVMDRWTASNPNSDVPRAIAYGASANNNNRFSNRYVENGSYLRFSNLQIGYTLPAKVSAKTKFLSNVRLFVSGSNLFVITRYSGFDPEDDLVPPARTIMGGITLSL